jgi:hypothetical protein
MKLLVVYFLHLSVTSSHPGYNSFFIALFSASLDLCLSLSYSQKTRGKAQFIDMFRNINENTTWNIMQIFRTENTVFYFLVNLFDLILVNL